MDDRKGTNANANAPKPYSMKDLVWMCDNCKFMLGVVSASKSELRLKYKDFYVVVHEGIVDTICRRCGKINRLDSTSAGEKVSKLIDG